MARSQLLEQTAAVAALHHQQSEHEIRKAQEAWPQKECRDEAELVEEEPRE